MIVAADYPFLDVLWTMVIFFVWVLWFWLLFTVFADIFRRQRWIVVKHLFLRPAGGQKFHDKFDRNPRAPDQRQC